MAEKKGRRIEFIHHPSQLQHLPPPRCFGALLFSAFKKVRCRNSTKVKLRWMRRTNDNFPLLLSVDPCIQIHQNWIPSSMMKVANCEFKTGTETYTIQNWRVYTVPFLTKCIVLTMQSFVFGACKTIPSSQPNPKKRGKEDLYLY